MTTAMSQPLAPGEPAPYFELPAVADDNTISLSDYRGRSPLFLALMVGLWCPFCRRQLVRIGSFEDKLKALGVESLAVVATEGANLGVMAYEMTMLVRRMGTHLTATPRAVEHPAAR